jgi:hypothetical protein
MYTWLFDKYRGSITNWTSERELAKQLKMAYLSEAPRLLASINQLDAPFDPLQGLYSQGVHDLRWIEGLPEEAKLIPDDKGFILCLRKIGGEISLDSSELPTRLRTTLAHELGHTFFYDRSIFPPKSSSSYLSSSGLHKADFKEEWWCMDFARAYLVPEFWAVDHLKRGELPSLEFASRIRKQLVVSWDILFRRLLWDLKVWRNCMIFRVDIPRLQSTGLWKSEGFKNWSFRRWLESEGKRLISERLREGVLSGEAICQIANSKGEEFQVRLLETSERHILLGAICAFPSHGQLANSPKAAPQPKPQRPTRTTSIGANYSN